SSLVRRVARVSSLFCAARNRETINEEGAMKLQQLWSLPVSLPDAGISSDRWHAFVARPLQWLDYADGRVHVVSTASVPLLPLVESGLLLEHLFHWLTAAQVDVQMLNQHPHPTTSRQSVGF